MIFHLLSLRSRCTEKGSSTEEKILSLHVEILINQEVFLFGTNGGIDSLYCGIAKQAEHSYSLMIESVHRTKQGSLLIQGFTAIGAKCSGDIKCAILNKGRRGRIPCSIATCFEGGADTTGREGRCIRFTLDQFLTRETHENGTILLRSDKAVMLLSGETSHGLEPMGEMCSTLFNSPFLHYSSNGICGFKFQRSSIRNSLTESLVGCLGQAFFHDTVIKNHTSIEFGY